MKDKMISVDEKTYNLIKQLSEEEERTLRGMIRVMLSTYLKQKENQ